MLMYALLLASVACEVIGQLCFKRGTDDDADATGAVVGFFRRLARSPWILAGVAVYAVEFVVWFAALTLAPLSLAFSFAALSYCGVVLASRIVLHERVSPRQWLATGTIAIGVALACWPTDGLPHA